MAQSIGHIVERLVRSLDDQRAATRVDTLVLGPSVEGRCRKHSAKLRKELLRLCPEHGTTVKGEHRELMRAARKRMRKGYNLCSYERLLAMEVDLVIIVPDSPGSFAELGLFALNGDVCSKTLVLLNKQHSKHHSRVKSYIHDGPRKAYKFRGAELRWVDYKDTARVWRIVEGKIEQVRTVKMDRTLA
jgi:hypothetical protein